MLTLLSPGASCSHGSSCSQPVALDPSYAPDHQNYLCMNYTRPTPLPCRDTAHGWAPRWFDGKGRPRFIIYAWWPPATPDFGAYADAGFNLALTENALGGVCQRKGPNATVTHDELFDANVAAANALSALGILTVFSTGNDCNAQLATSPTVAYGNATVTLTLIPTLTLTLTVTVTVTVTLTLSLSLTLTLTLTRAASSRASSISRPGRPAMASIGLGRWRAPKGRP